MSALLLTAIGERHRHRWEFNNEYLDIMKKNGLIISGIFPAGELIEIVELKEHPFFIAVQFHPELKSRPSRPHPLFKALVAAAKENKRMSKLNTPKSIKT